MMKTGLKISIIGAGSGVFSLGIVRDLCLTKGLWGSTVSFMDIDKERLDMVHNVASRYAAELGVDLKLEKTTDRRQTLQGADFVINTALVVGHEARHALLEVGRKYGYWRGVRGHSVPGRFHQLRLFMSIVQDIEEICPDAWYIQCANPMLEGCTLVTRNFDVKTVGLCHGFHGGVRDMSRTLGLEPEKVEAQAFGVNHFIWLTQFRYQGQDAYPLIDEWIEEKAEDFWASPECGAANQMGRKAVDIYKRLGLLPIGDTVKAFRWYHTDRETEKKWHEDSIGWFDHHVERVTKRLDDMFQVAADPSLKVTEVFPPERTYETNVSIINAIANDKPTMFQVNIPNCGAIPGVADDVVVEIPALVSAGGIQGLHVGDLPRPIMCHLLEKVVNMERQLEAFRTGDKRMLLELILSRPGTKTIEQARGVMEEILALPFNRDMAEYFKWGGHQ